MTFAYALVVGAVLLAAAVFTASWRRERGTALASLPMAAAGVAICLAGASRFSAVHDPGTGQELAVLVSVIALAAVILGAAWARKGEAR